MKARDASAIGAAGVGTSAALTAALASACCVGPSIAPIAMSLLGAGGLIAVSGLRPYTPILLVGAALMLAFSFRQCYWKPEVRCEDSTRISRGLRIARIITWIASLLWLVSVADSIYGFIHE